ncbi:hypothetical protein [Flavobacterium sp.]|uniref:hypothetical protein n=1 Tax=Flavobacterium sp. TaxID=239 RepID=UPI003753D467
METISINIINPKARKLIADLVDLDLIEINDPKSTLRRLLQKTRKFSDEAPSMKEITTEVEIVRKEMYDEKTKNSD